MDANFRKRLATRIAQARKAAGLTQAELAFRIEVDQSQVSRLERGMSGISVEQLLQLGDVLGVPISGFIGEIEGEVEGEGEGEGEAVATPTDASDGDAKAAMRIVLAWLELSRAQRELVRKLMATLDDVGGGAR